jgi:hypothetical protein
MDFISGNSHTMTADARPIHTLWASSTVSRWKRDHNRISRRRYRQYLRTGDIRDFNRAMRKLTNWDFD